MYLLTFLLSIATTFSLLGADIIAYDCQDKSTELTKLSLLGVVPCRDPKNATSSIPRRIQLIQKRQHVLVHVHTCLVTVQQLVQRCGMFSHTSAISGGLARNVHTINRDACIRAHKSKSLDLHGIGAGLLTKLLPNGTTEISTTLHGHIAMDGTCNGAKFSIGNQVFDNVIVSAAITIKLADYTTTANVERNIVNLRSGTVCVYNDGYCFDDQVGEVVWEQNHAHICNSQGVDVLWEGNATILTVSQTPIVKYVVVDTEETVFALRLTKTEEICHQRAWQTEQNRLLIIIEDELGFYYRRSFVIAQNTDLMAQVLSKLLFLEIAVKKQMAELVYDAIVKRCELREAILANRIALAQQSPEMIGNLIKENSGFIGRVMGEVLYIAKCKPVIVEYRRTQSCYQELPIYYQNRSMFRIPVTHIISEYGTEIDCQGLLPATFYLEGNWVELAPGLRRADTPMQLDANVEQDTITLTRISPISSHGVYTNEEMERFQNTLLFPNEKRAITNEVARRVTGRDTEYQKLYIPNIFNADEFKNIAKSAATEVWGFLSYMGNLFSIFGFLLTVFHLVSYAASVAINYWTIKRVSEEHPKRKRYLWASLWNALTHRYVYKLHREYLESLNQMEMGDLGPRALPSASSATSATAPSSTEQEKNEAPLYPKVCHDLKCMENTN